MRSFPVRVKYNPPDSSMLISTHTQQHRRCLRCRGVIVVAAMLTAAARSIAARLAVAFIVTAR